MERYSEYRDSGIKWLGQIPGHWKTIRVKSLLSERVEKSDTGTEEPLSMSQKYGIIPTKDMDVVPNMASTYVGAKKVFKNDLVFNKLKAHLGVFAISNYDGLVSPDYAVYTPNGRTYLPFMEYMFHTPLYIGEFTRKATGVAIGLTRLYTNGLFAIPFLYPPIEEQYAIVSYLDDKCAKIDKMLEGKQKQIELLAEMKQRIIADAVTRGLNPNVKMKATNIPWLPEIPEHWKLRRLKSLFTQRTESYNSNEQLEVLSLLKDVGVIPYSEKGNVGNKAKEDYSSYRVTRKGDIVMNSMNVIIGSVDITQYDGYVSPAYYALTAKSGVSTEYYNYIFHMKACQKHMRSLANGILEIRLRISTTSLFGMYYPVPPQEEQIAIVNYVQERISKIDCLVKKLQQEIESIKEYKQRLISDVVTGQIKVC